MEIKVYLNSFEDIALIRTLPNLKIFSPGTKSEVVKCCNMIFNSSGPSYMRLGKAPNNDYNISKTELELGRLLFVTVRSEIKPEINQLSDEVRGPFELKYGPQLLMLWHVYFK